MMVFRKIMLNGSVLEECPFQRESELQGYLIAHPELLSLAEADEQFEVSDIIGVERTVKNGRVDMVVNYQSGHIAIVELKRGEIVREDLDQLRRYLGNLDDVRQWRVFDDFKKENDEFDEEVSDKNVFGILVGRTVSKEVEDELGNNAKPVINTLTVKRFRSGYGEYLTTEASTHFSVRDYRKYIVNGIGPLGKGRMVLEAIRAYLSRNQNAVHYEQLISDKCFPASLRGTKGKWGCVALLDEAKELAERTGHKRHFLDSVISLNGDCRVVVSSQWGIGNVDPFIKRARSLGVEIEVVQPRTRTKNPNVIREPRSMK